SQGEGGTAILIQCVVAGICGLCFTFCGCAADRLCSVGILHMRDSSKLNIRYLGFECTVDGGRLLDFSVTAPGRNATRVRFDIPCGAFSGSNRISFQDSAALCYEKLRAVIEREEIQDALYLRVTDQDIQQFRPRGRRAAARAKA